MLFVIELQIRTSNTAHTQGFIILLFLTPLNNLIYVYIFGFFCTLLHNNFAQNKCLILLCLVKCEKKSNTYRSGSPGHNDTSLNYVAACWRLRSSFRLQITDPGPWIHHVPLFACLSSPLSSLSETASRWILPSASPGEVCARVFVPIKIWVCVCVCVSFHFDGNVGSNVSNGR